MSSNEAITAQISGSVRRLLGHVLKQDQHPATNLPGSAASGLRQSKGLREFWNAVGATEGMQILDLGAASQENINFITGLGHRLCTEDLYGSLQFKSTRTPTAEAIESEAVQFFQGNLNYQKGQFDGVLCWDLLDFLPDSVIEPLITVLYQFLKPDGHLLAFFHAGQPGQIVPVEQYRIRGADQLKVTQRGTGKLWRSFNNRAIESLFRDYASLRFFLTKDSLREVIITR
ncbi:MAG: class I SAM-dependent methyltransferase [Acidobacteria bacterium]|nr:class I SAM-dependent methyltransferase [Acidobacteriota bacterium]